MNANPSLGAPESSVDAPIPLAGWAGLVALPVGALCSRGLLVDYGFMWVLAFSLFAGCKWLTFLDTLASHASVRPGRVIGYLLFWPGMDAPRFFDPARIAKTPLPREWLFAAMKTLVGAALIWVLVPRLAPDALLTGWVGMTGIVLMLHFGVFHLLSLGWRAAGVVADPIMNSPLRARSVGDFWGRRWNAAFHELVHRYAYRPVRRRAGTALTACSAFMISGLVHEAVISFPARGGYGGPLSYFLIQGGGLLFERSSLAARIGICDGWRGRAFAFAVIALPVPLLFPPPFVENVILPFLSAIRL